MTPAAGRRQKGSAHPTSFTIHAPHVSTQLSVTPDFEYEDIDQYGIQGSAVAKLSGITAGPSMKSLLKACSVLRTCDHL